MVKEIRSRLPRVFAELGEEAVEGDLSNLTTIPGYVQADAGVEVISCWCSGLADFYLTLAQVE